MTIPHKIVDVSNNNGRVDFAAVKRSGAVGVYLKVTEGTSFVDGTYRANRAAAKRAGLKVGGYHFAHPSNSGATEAAFFLSHLIVEPGDLIPMLDLERSAAPKPEGAVKPYAQAFIRAVEARKGHCGLYCGSYFIQEHGLADLAVPRWIPSYGAKPRLYSYVAWQFSDGQAKYPGAIQRLDTSYVYDLARLTMPSAPRPKPKPRPAPAPTPAPSPTPAPKPAPQPSHAKRAAALHKMRGGYSLWREWVLGIGRAKGLKPREADARPHVLRRIPKRWWRRLRKKS